MRLHKLSFAITTLFAAISSHASGVSLGSLGTYSLITVPTSAGSSSYGTGISDNGAVVGYSQDGSGVQTSFIYANGQKTNLGTLGGASTFAWAINNSNWVVGSSQTSNGTWDAFIYKNGSMTDLGTFGYSAARARSINNDGTYTVTAYNSGPSSTSFICSGVSCTNVQPSGTAWASIGYINSAGVAVGAIGSARYGGQLYQAAFWLPNNYSNPIVNGGFNSALTGINNKNQAVGWGNGYSNLAAIYYSSPTAQERDTGVYFGGFGNWSSASAINDLGVFMGLSYTTSGLQHSFVSMDGQTFDLTALFGFQVQDSNANELNQLSMIAGTIQTSNGYQAAILVPDAVLATPIPAAAWLMISGIGALGVTARRRKQTA
jgi:probable HAF family extracellular repeat protein